MKVIKSDFRPIKKFTIFAASDLHLGNLLCHEKKIKEDFDEAIERNSRIIIHGDWADAIFPRDPRSVPHLLKKEFRGRDDVCDFLVEYAVKLFKPYAKNIEVIGDGNHEWEINKRFATNITARLVRRLNQEYNVNIKYGGYSFYYIFNVCYCKKKSPVVKPFKVFAHHGKGTSAPVTKGMIDISRWRDAGWIYDLLIFGHKHNSFANKNVFIRPKIPHKGNYGYLDITKAREVQTGTYKRTLSVNPENVNQMSSWAEKTALAPTNLGGNFVNVNLKRVRVHPENEELNKFDRTSTARNMEFYITVEV